MFPPVTVALVQFAPLILGSGMSMLPTWSVNSSNPTCTLNASLTNNASNVGSLAVAEGKAIAGQTASCTWSPNNSDTGSASILVIKSGQGTPNFQPAIARIRITKTKTQTSITKVAGYVTKTQTSVAHIKGPIKTTQSATGRISITRTSDTTLSLLTSAHDGSFD